MALNITVVDLIRARSGSLPPCSRLPVDTTNHQVVALGAQSTAITGPCTICLIADEGQRFQPTKTAGYAAPGAGGKKLLANVERWHDIPDAGTYYINCVAG